MNELLEEYKKMPKNIQENLYILNSYHTCYMRDKNISDDMVEFVSSLAKSCWLEDDYSSAGITNYTEYLLDAIYEYNASKEELDALDIKDIVEAFNNDYSAEEILKFDKTDYEYCFSTKDRQNYYSDGEGFYVLNDDDRCIKRPHPMENPLDDVFSLLNDDKIVYMPLNTHYNIRCMIKDDILVDDELKKRYNVGIENYKKYCENNFITSEDILYKCGLDTNITLTDIDEKYTQINMMNRLSKFYNNIHKDGSKYSYVASLNNGIDYYYKRGKYLALDKNNVAKEFDEKNKFLFKELNGKYKFIHIEPKERMKIVKEIEHDLKDFAQSKAKSNSFDKDGWYEVDTFLNYEMEKELDSFQSSSLANLLALKLSYNERQMQNAKNDINKEFNNRKKEISDAHEI